MLHSTENYDMILTERGGGIWNLRTKKLLEYIGAKPEKMSAEVDPLFEWTANLMVINRRKTIVVVHAASRCSFVLHGMTVKHLKNCRSGF